MTSRKALLGASLLTTTYLGHQIEIELFEWGYVAHVLEPESNRRFTSACASAFEALEEAFGIVEQVRELPQEVASLDGSASEPWPSRPSMIVSTEPSTRSSRS
jgi:hypothetical protein